MHLFALGMCSALSYLLLVGDLNLVGDSLKTSVMVTQYFCNVLIIN